MLFIVGYKLWNELINRESVMRGLIMDIILLILKIGLIAIALGLYGMLGYGISCFLIAKLSPWAKVNPKEVPNSTIFPNSIKAVFV